MDHEAVFCLTVAYGRRAAEPLALAFDDVRQVVADAFADHLALKLSEIDEHVAQETTDGGGGVDVLRHADEVAFVAFEVLHETVEVADGSSKAVELVHDDIAHVAMFDPAQHLLEGGAIRGATSGNVKIAVDVNELHVVQCAVLSDLG